MEEIEKKQIILNEIKSQALENKVPILQDVSLELILMILNIKKPNKILEIGTAVGYSAINFATTLQGKNAKIKTIELKENMYNIALKNVKDMGLDEKIEIVHADATEYLKTLNEDNTYDVVFTCFFSSLDSFLYSSHGIFSWVSLSTTVNVVRNTGKDFSPFSTCTGS